MSDLSLALAFVATVALTIAAILSPRREKSGCARATVPKSTPSWWR